MRPGFRLRKRLPRRAFLQGAAAAASTVALAGCDNLSRTEWFPKVLDSVEPLNHSLAKLLGRKAMAQEFAESDRSPDFRSNGSDMADTDQYNAWLANKFADYALNVGGLCEAPRKFSLADLRALPSRTQVTRHDCVEGWSAIAKWKGARLAALLDVVKPKPEARFVIVPDAGHSALEPGIRAALVNATESYRMSVADDQLFAPRFPWEAA